MIFYDVPYYSLVCGLELDLAGLGGGNGELMMYHPLHPLQVGAMEESRLQ